MTELFYAVLKASFQGSVVILAVLLLRLLLKKAPKSVFCLLWLLAGLRLVLPFEIESKLSLQPDYTPEPQAVVQPDILDNIPDYQGDILIDIPDNFQAAPEHPAQPEVDGEKLPTVTYPTAQPVGEKATFEAIAAPVWLLGMGIMVAASVFSYIRLKRRVRMAYLIENGCFECPGLDTAFVLGFLPPKVYLPAGLTDSEKKFIYDHENTHIARSDHWFKLLGWLVLSLHWFNPLVWLGYSMLCRDIELACDEHVVRNMSLAQRKAYSAALLSCGGHTARIAACPVAFGESNPKKRILNVLNYKRPGFWISLTAVISVIFVAVCLLTSPGEQNLMKLVGEKEIPTDVYIGTSRYLTGVAGDEERQKLEKMLRGSYWDPDSPQEVPAAREEWGIYLFDLTPESTLYFSEDCTLVWAEGTAAYPVRNPEKLRTYLQAATDGVWNKKTSGEPFASMDQPGLWLNGISDDAVSTAEIYWISPTTSEGNTTSKSVSFGYLSAEKLDALLKILNSLLKSAIAQEGTVPRQTFGQLTTAPAPYGGLTVTLYDDVNDLAAVLRLVKNDTLELVFVSEPDQAEEEMTWLENPRCWILENKALLTLLQGWNEAPPVLHLVTTHPEKVPEWNLEMQVADVTPGGLTVKFIQSGDFPGRGSATLQYGTYYTLETWTDGTWKAVEELPQKYEVAWTTEAYLINLNSTTAFNVDWAWLYGELPAGRYRIGKDVSLSGAPGDTESQVLYGEFTIEETEPEQPAWNMEMTDEEFLAMCRDAAEKFQEQEHYHISETYVYYINDKEACRDYCTYWRAGDNWLRDSQATKLRENTDAFYYEGNLYLRRNAEAGWTKVDGGAGYNRVWLEMLDWDAQEINFTFAEQVEDVLHVFVTVKASPPTIGWDDVSEYMLGFFFDTDGNLLSAMMGCTREEINVMSDLRMNSTTAQSIRTKLEQEGEQCHGDSATCSDPDCTDPTHDHYGIACTVEGCTNPAHQHNIDELAAEYEAKLQLAKCAAALEEYQSQGTWAIQTESSFWGAGVLNDSSLSQWFGNGEDYYTWTRIPEDGGDALWFDLCVDGDAYHRHVYSVAGGTTEDWDTLWEEGSTDDQVIYPHWPLWYDWESADIEFVEQVTTDSMESVTFTVQGCPFPEHPDRIDEYQVTFHFQEDVLFWIQLTYQRADALGGGKREYKLSAFTPADAENISKCHSEALLDINGICTDPDCTDSSHHHDDHH